MKAIRNRYSTAVSALRVINSRVPMASARGQREFITCDARNCRAISVIYPYTLVFGR